MTFINYKARNFDAVCESVAVIPEFLTDGSVLNVHDRSKIRENSQNAQNNALYT